MHRGLFSMQLHWTAAAFQLHASSPSLPSEPELRSLWNVMTGLKREKCVGQHDELRIESSQLRHAGPFFFSFTPIARNLNIINGVVKVLEHMRPRSIISTVESWNSTNIYLNTSRWWYVARTKFEL